MVSILVTGGAGYIGSHMTRMLAASGLQPVVVDDLSSGRRKAVGHAPLHVGDCGDPDFIGRVIDATRPAAVMHFAGSIQVGESVRNPALYYRNNLVATQALLDAMVGRGIPRLVFSSTAAIFGAPVRIPIDEDHPKAPINPYGRGKWMVEQILEDYDRAYGLKSACLRYFNAAGADPGAGVGECHEPETHLIPLVLQVCSGRRRQVAVYGDDYDTPDGTCIRDYIHVQDLCQAHLLALRGLLSGGGSGRYNLGNGRGSSVLEVIEAARRVTGHAIPVTVEHRRPGDPPRLVADATLAREALGWTPRYADLDTIISHAWEWERRHRDWPR